MISDIKNSIKAKLYDFTYTPFMSSMIIAWIILNHKYLLIYFAGYSLDKKLVLLNGYDFSASIFGLTVPYVMNVWFPIAFGLFYVFAYPWASKIFYEYTLERTKGLKEIKQKIEDVTPITQEEARQIRSDIERLTTERDKLREKVIQAETFYKEKYQKQKNDLPATDSSWTPASVTEIDDDQQPKEDDEKKVLRFFYESNYKPSYESTLLDNIVKVTGLARPKADKIYNDLKKEDILKKRTDNKVEITSIGNTILLEKFDI